MTTSQHPIPLFKVKMAGDAPDRVAEVLRSGYIGQGPMVDRFEAALQTAFVVDAPVLTTNSCTSALDLALHLCGVGPGTAVITTPMTCSATNSPIVTRGATPLWADVAPHSGNIDPASVARLLTMHRDDAIRAVVAVDWAGRACDYDALRDVVTPYGLPIIEDAAHAALATYHGRPISYMGGDYVCWSFQAIKHLTTGDGGALCLPDAQVERARLLRWYGLDRTKGESFRCAQNIAEVGYKYHMNDIAAAIGLANLPHLAATVHAHRQNARFYHDALAGLPGITLPPPDAGSSWWLYTILLDDAAARDAFIAHAAARGVAASQVHARNDTHSGFGGPLPTGTLPGVDAFAAREVAIPVGWWLSDDDRMRVVETVASFARSEAPAAQGVRLVKAPAKAATQKRPARTTAAAAALAGVA